MSTLTIAAILLALLLVLLVGGLWIALALAAVAWVGLQFFTSTPPDVNLFQSFWGSSASWTLAALPLFIWMGEILYRTKLSEEMFKGLAPWLGWLPGRLMHVNVLACGIFGTVSGSSAATCATIAKVALPELKARGYDEKTCLGSLCGAGTLGILLPPSIIMVVYAVAAEVSILKVFLAGIIPGVLLMLLFSGYIIVWAWRNPEKTPIESNTYTFKEKLYLSRNLIPCLLLIVFIVWVMVVGWATATEAAAFGVLGAFAIAAASGGLELGVVPRQSDGCDTFVVHDSVHTRRRGVPVVVHGFHRHSASAGGVGGGNESQSVHVDCRAGGDLYRAGQRARWRIDDRADHFHRDSDGGKSRLRSGVVRHLYRVAGGDRRSHAAAGLQFVRVADHERQGQHLCCACVDTVFLHDGAGDCADYGVPVAGDVAAEYRPQQVKPASALVP